MNSEYVLNLLEELLEFDSGPLLADRLLNTIESWDSLAIISFIALIDEKINVVLDGNSLANANTIEDLLKLVEKSVLDKVEQ